MKVEFCVNKAHLIASKVKAKFCCYEMYLATCIYNHLKLPSKEKANAQLNGINISHCPYCGEKIEIVAIEEKEEK